MFTGRNYDSETGLPDLPAIRPVGKRRVNIYYYGDQPTATRTNARLKRLRLRGS